MDSRTVLAYLRQLCVDMDHDRPLRPFAAMGRVAAPIALPAALAMSFGLTACETTPAVRLPQDQPEVCDDGVDNDHDGLTDCGDPACGTAPNCLPQRPEPRDDELPTPAPEYAAPIEEPPPPPDAGAVAAPPVDASPGPASESDAASPVTRPTKRPVRPTPPRPRYGAPAPRPPSPAGPSISD